MHGRTIFALVAALVAVGCSDPFTVVDGPVEVARTESALVVTNRHTEDPVNVVVIEERSSQLIDLAPCDEWEPHLGPGQTRRIPFTEIFNYDPSSRAFVMWCRLDADGRIADGGSFTVPF